MSDQFLPEDFAEVARLLRVNLNRTGGFQAVCSNNHNVILAALDQAAANADLLAALKLCLPILDDEFGTYGPNEPETHAIARARAAIAKAETNQGKDAG